MGMMLHSVPPWALFVVVVLVGALACRLTDRWRSPRVLRALARQIFVVAVLLFVYQLVLLAFTGGSVPAVFLPAPVTHQGPVGADSVVGAPSLSAAFVNQVLAAAGSPAAGTGQSLYDLSVQYHIDDAYALATFQHESSYGKYGYASVDHSLGNIVCAGYPTCNGRFRWYATWAQGFADFYQLIAREYVAHGLTTLTRILPVYAPSSENDTAGYIESIRRAMVDFRAGHLS
jgi:hypothetical protein